MREKLIPPDLKQCQGERIEYHPFRMGGNVYDTIRCVNQPKVIATETKRADGKKRGSMSLCGHCLDIAVKQLGNKITFKAV